MNIHKEVHLEDESCEHLSANGWLYADKDAAGYDRKRALFPVDVLTWVQGTQPDAWEVLTKNHGDAAGQTLLNRLRDSLNQSGTRLAKRVRCAGREEPSQDGSVQASLGDEP